MAKNEIAAEAKAVQAKVEEKAAEVATEVKAAEKKVEKAASKAKADAKKTAKKAEKAVKDTAKKAEKAVKDGAKKAEKAVKGAKATATETVFVQFAGAETDVAALVEAAKAAFKAEKSRTAIHDLKLYVKPEEQAAYYVVNGEFTGKVGF